MTGTQRPGVVSVILVNFRGADDTITCVRTLRALDFPQDRLEIIVVENASGDDSLVRLNALVDLAVIVASPFNGGFTGGCNLGAARASGEFIAFLNNDARPGEDWISAALSTFDEGADVGAVASKVLDWDGMEVDYVAAAITWFGMGYKPNAGVTDDGTWDDERDVLFGTGAAMFIRAEVFEKLGGFDERYFMFYEDVDLGWRLNLLGYRFRYQPKSLAYHHHHASMSKFGDYHETYLLERNALYTLYKNLGDDALSRFLPGALLLAIRRATGRAGRDTESFDLRRSADDDRESSALVSKELLAGVDAIDRLVENLPSLDASRRAIQSSRVRSDGSVFQLFGNVDEPAYPIDTYLKGYENIVDSLDVLSDGRRRHVLIITGDPIGEKMAGPAIRAWNMADVLADESDVRLVSMTGVSIATPRFETGVVSYRYPSTMEPHERWADVIVLQGHALALFPVLDTTSKPLVIDIYDPLHLEALEQGRDPDIALWSERVEDATEVLTHQLERGDFFICASDRQRHFWLGQLAAAGRLNPQNYRNDPDLDSLIGVVPFGLPSEPPVQTEPAMRGVVPGIGRDDKLIIWAGGIYDWFDPETLIRSIGKLAESHPDVRLFFMGTRHPNPAVPEMHAVTTARSLSEELGLTGTHVFFNDSWVDYDSRQNYLVEADLGVSTHFQHVETTFSFRTRILDYLWAGLPIVTTRGDSFGDLVVEERLGAAVPERDDVALASALERLLYDDDAIKQAKANVSRVRADFEWARVLRPVVEFMHSPRLASDRAPGVLIARRRPRARHTGLARDLDRIRFYLAHGGIRTVISRFIARRARRSAAPR